MLLSMVLGYTFDIGAFKILFCVLFWFLFFILVLILAATMFGAAKVSKTVDSSSLAGSTSKRHLTMTIAWLLGSGAYLWHYSEPLLAGGAVFMAAATLIIVNHANKTLHQT